VLFSTTERVTGTANSLQTSAVPRDEAHALPSDLLAPAPVVLPAAQYGAEPVAGEWNSAEVVADNTPPTELAQPVETDLPSIGPAPLQGFQVPLDLAGLDLALANFLNDLNQVGTSLAGANHQTYWILAVVLALASCEVGRRQLRAESNSRQAKQDLFLSLT